MNHSVLLEKLAIYRCSEQALRWFSSHLSEHQQIVQFKNTLNNPSEVTTDIPRGSIPGPLFFIVFMNDMPLNTTTNVTADMYADDSTITATGKSTQSVKLSLNNDLQEISNWCDENRMGISAEKPKIMIVTTRQKWRYFDTTDPDVWIKGDNLLVVESQKLLCHFKQGKHFITVTATQSRAVHRHQSVLSNYRNVLPESSQTLNTEQRVPHS